jgi:hypothetical protein
MDLDVDALYQALSRLPPGPYREGCCAKHELEDARDDGLACYGIYSGDSKFRPDPRIVVPLLNAARALLTLALQVPELTRERDDARQWVRDLTSTERVLTCIYCGHAYPPGTPAHGTPVLTAHIEECEKHPLRALRVAARHLARLMETRKQTQADQDAVDAVKLALGETPTPVDA